MEPDARVGQDVELVAVPRPGPRRRLGLLC